MSEKIVLPVPPTSVEAVEEKLNVLVSLLRTTYYYGPTLQVALPTFIDTVATITKDGVVDEDFAPVPYAVAVYEYEEDAPVAFTYHLLGVEVYC